MPDKALYLPYMQEWVSSSVKMNATPLFVSQDLDEGSGGGVVLLEQGHYLNECDICVTKAKLMTLFCFSAKTTVIAIFLSGSCERFV